MHPSVSYAPPSLSIRRALCHANSAHTAIETSSGGRISHPSGSCFQQKSSLDSAHVEKWPMKRMGGILVTPEPFILKGKLSICPDNSNISTKRGFALVAFEGENKVNKI
jgi:hypothetical protein